MMSAMSSDRLGRLYEFWTSLVPILMLVSIVGGGILIVYGDMWASIWMVCGMILTIISIKKSDKYAPLARMANLSRAQAKAWVIVDPEMT